MQTLRQIEFSLLDMQLHASMGADVLATLQQVRAEVAVLPSPDFSRTPHSFSHIFAGGYAAGYYSYKWAELLSADAYAAFEEAEAQAAGSSAATGRKFLQEILEKGGSRSAAYAQLYSRVSMRLVRGLPLNGDVEAIANAWNIHDEKLLAYLRKIVMTPGGLRNGTHALELASMLAAAVPWWRCSTARISSALASRRRGLRR